MKLWRYTLGFLLFVVFIAFALTNNETVKVNVYLDLINESGIKFVYLPIYAIIFVTLFIGIIIGVFIENIRNAKARNLMRLKDIELKKVELELKKNKDKFFSEEEKIMDLLTK